MASRFVRKLALLAKIESVYGTDVVPTGSLNAVLATNVNFTPMAGSEESRDLLLPYMGHQGIILTGDHVMVEFSVEIAGAGTAGDVPGYGSLLRMCGLSETIDTGVSVEYEPVSSGFEAGTIYYNLDGVRHILLGARGNVSLEMSPQRIPRYRFRILGLKGTISDTALPSVTVTVFKKPLVVNKANTTFSLHSYSGPMEAFSLDLGNQVEPRLLVGYEGIPIVDRKSTGSATMEAALLAAKNWFAIATAGTTGTLAAVHGLTAGNIVEITAPAVQIGRPTQGSSQGIANYALPLMFLPDAGNDDLKITVR